MQTGKTTNNIAFGRFGGLAKSQAGNVLPMTAIAMVALAGLVGGGVDISRGYMVQNRLQNACDAGVLAGRRAVDDSGLDTAAKNQAKIFFETNFDQDEEGVSATNFVTTSNDNGKTVAGAATTTLNTAIMQLFGFDTVALSVSCSASLSVGNSDVMMVLDTTGSMANKIDGSSTTNDTLRRITYLRTAMKDFYDTVHASTAGTNSRVRYGFVPYSSSVNVGHLLDPSWLVDSHAYQSREPKFKTITSTTTTYAPPVYSEQSASSDNGSTNWSKVNNNQYSNSNSCEATLPAEGDWQNDGNSSTSTTVTINGANQRVTRERKTQPQQKTIYQCAVSGNKYRPYYRVLYRTSYFDKIWTEDPIYTTTTSSVFDKWLYKRRTLNTSNYKQFNSTTVDNGNDGTNISYTWPGCIEERKTESEPTFSFSSLTGMSPDVNDLDLDSAPDGTDDTKWAPLWPEIIYRRGTDSSIYNQTEGYTGYQTSSFCPSRASLFAQLDEAAFDAVADGLKAEGSTYHDIGMIWGGRLASQDGLFASNVNTAPANGGAVARHLIFMTDGYMQPNFAIGSAYGTEYYDKRITDDGYSDITARHTSRFLAMCSAVKAKGIRVWVIAFASELTTDLEKCASNNSSFDANSSEKLNEAFQEIAKDVGELRVTQ